VAFGTWGHYCVPASGVEFVQTSLNGNTSDRGICHLFGRFWPVAHLAAAVIVNLAWIGFLGYGFFKLVEPAFS
jgi:hypothetical protein